MKFYMSSYVTNVLWYVEECNFERYYYCIIVVFILEDIHIVFDHVKNPKRMNVTPLVKSTQKNPEETLIRII